MKIHKKTLSFSCLLILFIIICLCSSNSIFLLNWLGILIYIYAIYTWHWEKKEGLFSLYTIFFSFFSIFNYGQCFMWALGIGLDRGIGTGSLFYGTHFVPYEEHMILTKWYICMAMLFFHLGALIFVKRKKNRNVKNTKKIMIERKILLKIGIAIALIIVPLALYVRYKEVKIALMYGYNALYYGEHSTQTGYLQIFMYLFFPSLVCLLVGSNFSSRMKKIVFAVFILYAILGVISGDRGGWLYSLILIVWACLEKKGGIKLKKVMKLGVIAVLGLYFLQVITMARDGGGISDLRIESFLEAFNLEKSPVVDAFFEMGGSMGIITYLLYSGNKIYPYANTYLTSILGSFSSRVLSIFGMKQVLIGDWFSQEYLGISWGTGFSMLGEAYINGGMIGGLVYMFIFGVIIGKFLYGCTSLDLRKDPVKAFIAISAANILLGFPRAALYLVVKNFIYGVLIILLLFYIMKKKIRIN